MQKLSFTSFLSKHIIGYTKRLAGAFCLVLFWAILPASAQDLPFKDAREILLQASNTASEFELLLNTISNTNAGPAEIQEICLNSYSAGPNQIFADKTVIIEDNINQST